MIVAQFKSSLIGIDDQVNLWTMSIHTDSFTAIAVVIAYVFDTTSLIVISFVITAYLFYRNYRLYGTLLLAAMGGDALLVSVAKELIQSPRPSDSLVYDTGFSFPSGHTVASIVFCGLLTYFAWQHWKGSKAKIISSVLFISIASIVAFDRIYLNVHWFSDVFGGFFLGLFWLTISLLVSRHVQKTNRFQSSKFWTKPTASSVC